MSHQFKSGDIVLCAHGITFPWGEEIVQGKSYQIQEVHDDDKVSVIGIVTPTWSGRFTKFEQTAKTEEIKAPAEPAVGLADLILEQMNRIDRLTAFQMVRGFDSSCIVLSVNSELGEVCEAIASEDGHKDRSVDESSVVEAVDLISCAISLYFARGGTIAEFPSILERKMNKWELKLTDRYSKAQPS